MPPSINRDIAKSIGLAVRNDTITPDGSISGGGGGGVTNYSFDSAEGFLTVDSSGLAAGDLGWADAANTLAVWNDSEGSWYEITKSAGAIGADLEATGGDISSVNVDGTQYKLHTFLSSGTFSVTGSTANVEYLVIGGGGGTAAGAGGDREAGAGAGGYRANITGENSGGGSSAESSKTVIVNDYTITVGAGGTGSNGGDTTFDNITSLGGGSASNADGAAGSDGGSGGGGWYGGTPGSGTAGQGYDGGSSGGGSNWTGGGGGGAGSAGSVSGDVSVGGDGVASAITGGEITRASGGQGNRYNSTPINTDGNANTGNGASGLASGGSGIVMIRYPYSGAITESDRPLQMFTATPNFASTGYKNATYISNISAEDGNFTIFTTNQSSSGVGDASNTADLPSGKRYGELEVIGSSSSQLIGIVPNDFTGGFNTTGANLISMNDGNIYPGPTSSGLGGMATTNDITMIAYDTDDQKVWFGLNGTWFTQGTPGVSGGIDLYGTSSDTYMMFMGSISSSNHTHEYKTYRNLENFNYTVPTGFLSW
jgi:hypothetical protein